VHDAQVAVLCRAYDFLVVAAAVNLRGDSVVVAGVAAAANLRAEGQCCRGWRKERTTSAVGGPCHAVNKCHRSVAVGLRMRSVPQYGVLRHR
jgi:hypothetical protein